MKKLLAATTAVILSIANVAYAGGPATIDLMKSMTATTQSSPTITAGGTYQQALAQNMSRKNCTIINTNSSDSLYVFFGTTTAANAVGSNNASLVITHGNSFNCAAASIGVVTDAIQITGANTSDTVTIIEQQ